MESGLLSIIDSDKDEMIRLAMQQEHGLVRAEYRIKHPMIRGDFGRASELWQPGQAPVNL